MNSTEILESLKSAHASLQKKQYKNGTGRLGILIRILERDETESQKSAIPIVSLSWLDSDLQKMAQKTREAYRDFDADKETIAAQAFINGCYAAKRYFEKQLSQG